MEGKGVKSGNRQQEMRDWKGSLKLGRQRRRKWNGLAKTGEEKTGEYDAQREARRPEEKNGGQIPQ